MDSRTHDHLIFEAHRKSTGASYLLWFFLGFLGAHRFYLGRTGSAVAQLLLCLSVIGIIPLAIWWLVDAFRIPDMVRDENMKTIDMLRGGKAREREQSLAKAQPDEREPRLTSPAPEAPSVDPRVEEIRAMRRR